MCSLIITDCDRFCQMHNYYFQCRSLSPRLCRSVLVPTRLPGRQSVLCGKNEHDMTQNSISFALAVGICRMQL